MKPIAFKIPHKVDSSLRVQIDKGVKFYDKFHYHTQYQITAIVAGEGVMLVGNNFTQFTAGDIFVLGSDVPHMMKNTILKEGETKDIQAHAISLFFTKNSFGEQFFEIPELVKASKMLHCSYRGIKLLKTDKSSSLFEEIKSCEFRSGLSLISSFFAILNKITESASEFINPEQFHQIYDQSDRHHWQKVFTYISENMSQSITLDSIAKVANLSISQFSLKFKEKTGKTFIQYLNAFRIESACTNLNNSDHTIERIAFDSGFRNLSNFNRQFKKLKDCSPKAYRNKL